MIAIIDYGMGNLRSVEKAFESIEARPKVTNRKVDIEDSKGIVLPGVGAFKDAIMKLRELKLIEIIKNNIKKGKPFLGLCLGLQLLFTESEEGNCPGFNIFKGRVIRFQDKLKVPHIGWNSIEIKKRVPNEVEGGSILSGIKSGTYFYFVHSYYAVPSDTNIVAATTNYGNEFCSLVAYNNIFATQFHPEKSQNMGLKIIRNFSKLC